MSMCAGKETCSPSSKATATPPLYSELGKECRDLFTKGFHIGLFKVLVKNTTCHGMEVKTGLTHQTDDKSCKADVEIKAGYPIKGLSTVHKWDTDNQLKNEVTLQDLLPGSKLTGEFRLNPDSNTLGGAFKGEYKHRFFTAEALLDGADDSNLAVGAGVVAGLEGLLATYRVDMDTGSGELKSNNVGLAYQTKEYGMFVTLDNMSLVNAYYLHKINRSIDVGAQVKVGGEEGGPLFSIAGKYQFNGYGHTIRAKVNNQSLLGVGLEFKVQQGMHLFGSTEVNLKDFAGGNHKIGFGLEFGL